MCLPFWETDRYLLHTVCLLNRGGHLGFTVDITKDVRSVFYCPLNSILNTKSSDQAVQISRLV